MSIKDTDKSSVSVEVANESPLRMAADPRFYMLIVRAIQRARVVPALPPASPKELNRSERSSWSSASAVSSIDLRSPEPILNKKDLSNKLISIKDGRRRRRLIGGFAIVATVLLLIGIALSIALPLTISKNTSTVSPTSDSLNGS